MAKKEFATSFHIAMTLIVISLLLLPFYYTHQFAWSQSQVSSDGQQQQESQTVQAGNNLSSSAVSGMGGLEDDGMIANQQLASNSSSYLFFQAKNSYSSHLLMPLDR